MCRKSYNEESVGYMGALTRIALAIQQNTEESEIVREWVEKEGKWKCFVEEVLSPILEKECHVYKKQNIHATT